MQQHAASLCRIGKVEMKKDRGQQNRSLARVGLASFRQGRWVIAILMLAIVSLAACSGDGDQAASTLDGDASDQTALETTPGENSNVEDGEDQTSDDVSGAEVEGAFAFALDFRSGELWGINPYTESIGVLTTVDSDSQRIWATVDDVWVAAPTELIHVDNSGERLGSVELEDVYDLAAGDAEVWVAGGTPSGSDRPPYLSKLDADGRSEVDSIESQTLTDEFGRFEDVTLGDDVIWLSYSLSSGRATEIDRMDRDNLEVVGTTTVPIEARSLIWDGTSLWAAGWRADSANFGIVQIAADGSVISDLEISDFEKSRGWDFAVTDDGLWLANLGSSELIRLDPATNTEVTRIQFAGLGLLEGVHVSDGRLWASVHQGDSSYIELTLYVIDRETNEPTTMMELPERLRAIFLSDG